jgi:O-antigen/teichoic acid export membrane protein
MSRGADLPPARALIWERILGRPIAGHANGNAIWSALDAVAGPLAALLMAAGLVRVLGTRDYGVIVVALAVSALSAAIIPAIGSTTTRFVAEAVTGKQVTAIARIVTAGLIAVFTVDVLLFLAAVVFKAELTRTIFGTKTSESDIPLGPILLLAVSAVCIQQIDGVFSATLKGLEQFKWQSLVEVVMRSLLAISSVAAALVTRNITAVLATYCGVCAVTVAVRVAVLRPLVPRALLMAVPSRTDWSRLLHFGGWMWLTAAAAVAFGTVDRIVVGRVAGPAAAAEYTIYIQLTQLIHFIPLSLFSFCFPVFSKLGVNKETNMPVISALYKRYFRIALAIALSLGLALLAFRGVILSLFGGPVLHQQDVPAFVLLVAGFVALSLNVLPYCLALGVGSAKFVSLVSTTAMFASLALTLSLTPVYGMEGAALGRLIYGIGAMAFMIRAHTILNRKFGGARVPRVRTDHGS